MADPLSIAASITGIITAAVKIAAVLCDLHDAPDHVADLSAEVNNIRIVFKAFQRLIDKPQSLPSRRAAMVQLEDVVVIVTETVLVFSELETIITPLATRQRSPIRALTWVWQRSTTTRLVNQLQRHKSSLTVVLQIIACNSDIEAADAAASLQDRIEEQVTMSTDISERLERLQLSIEGQELVDSDELPQDSLPIGNDSSNSQLRSDDQATLDEILENSTVYKRALYRAGNVTCFDSVLSRSWSIISGISLTKISVLAVLNLPLHDTEIQRFRQLVNVPEDNRQALEVPKERLLHHKTSIAANSQLAIPRRRRDCVSARMSSGLHIIARMRSEEKLKSLKLDPP